MRRKFLTSVAALTLGGALGGAIAQESFPDVPADSYAADAVSQLVELGIVNGFPDGTFRGNDAFTRYQAALVISRLLNVLEENFAAAGALSEEDLAMVNNAVAELTNELTALSERVAALEQVPAVTTSDLSAIEERLAALEVAPTDNFAETLAALEGRVAALEEAPTESVDVAALQEQVTALNQQVNDLQTQLSEVSTGAASTGSGAQPPTPGETAVDLAEAATAPAEAAIELAETVAAPAAVSAERSNFYLGVGGLYEAAYVRPNPDDDDDDNDDGNDDDDDNGGIGDDEGTFGFLNDIRVRPRFTVGVDDIIAGFGLRATVDYGRQALINTNFGSSSLATAGHLTYSLGGPEVSAYLGLGGGYHFDELGFVSDDDNAFVSDTAEGPFAGALLGAEFGRGPITFFVEGMADYYFNGTSAAGYQNQQLYPTVAAGFNLRP